MKGQLHGVFPDIVDMRIPHPFSRADQDDAAADRLHEKAVPDSLGNGMRSSGNASLGNDPAYLFMDRFLALRPNSLTGL